MQWRLIRNNVDIYNKWRDLNFLHGLEYEYECLIHVVNTLEYNERSNKKKEIHLLLQAHVTPSISFL